VLTRFNWLTQRIVRLVSFLEHAFIHLTQPSRHSLVFATATDLTRSKTERVAANALLRQQLIIFHRQVEKPHFTVRPPLACSPRQSRPSLERHPFNPQPDTLLYWHRQGFRLFWKFKSRNRGGGPKLSSETVTLLQQMAKENRLWGSESELVHFPRRRGG
jgi:hypothetical protein